MTTWELIQVIAVTLMLIAVIYLKHKEPKTQN